MLKLYVIDDQSATICEVLRSFVPPTEYAIERFEFDSSRSYSMQLEECRVGLFQRTDIDIVLLDVFFPGDSGTEEPIGRSLLLPLYGIGMPVILTSGSDDVQELIKSANLAGRCSFEFVQKRFSERANREHLLTVLSQMSIMLSDAPPYFRDNLKADESYAVEYDVAELSSMGTLFAIEWENNRVIDGVKAAIQNAVARDGLKNGIRILDIGCGTGRFEEVLMNQPFSRHISEIVGIDYSPSMLAAAHCRLPQELLDSGHVRMVRRLGERLFVGEELGAEPFDLVLMCFGVPSFVKDVTAFKEVHRVLRDGGTAIFTAYNRSAANHTFRKAFGQNATDVCAVIEFRDGVWMMGPDPNWIRFHVFNVDEFFAVLRTAGFKVERGSSDWATFPTLVSCTRKELLNRQAPKHVSRISYLDRDPLQIGFDERLYKMDIDYCKAFPESGYYINVVVSK